MRHSRVTVIASTGKAGVMFRVGAEHVDVGLVDRDAERLDVCSGYFGASSDSQVSTEARVLKPMDPAPLGEQSHLVAALRFAGVSGFLV